MFLRCNNLGYIRVLLGTAFAILVALPSSAGDLDPPPGTPAGTMRTLDEIGQVIDRVPPVWSNAIPDPERFKGVFDSQAWLDRETGLIWHASSQGPSSWNGAHDACLFSIAVVVLDTQIRKGWRLPTIPELQSLVATSSAPSGSTVAPGITFQGFDPTSYYWSATRGTLDESARVVVRFSDNDAKSFNQTAGSGRFLCVRGSIADTSAGN